MKRIILLATIMSITFYVMQYSEHGAGFSNYAIHCPIGGCIVAQKKIICADKECVEKALDEHGTEYLDGVWRVEWFDYGVPLEGQGNVLPTATKLKVNRAYKVE